MRLADPDQPGRNDPQRRSPRSSETAAPVLAIAAVLIDGGGLAAGLPTVRASLDASLSLAAWTAASAGIGFAAFLLVAVAVAERFGPRRLLAAGAVGVSLAALAAAAAPTMETLVAARVIQGVASAMAVGPSLVLLTDVEVGRRKPGALIAAVLAAAAAGGAVLGGALAELASWRAALLIAPIAGLAAAGLALRTRPAEPKPQTKAPIDWLGGVLVALALTAALWGLLGLSDGDAGRELVFAGFAAAAAALAAFHWRETSTAAPMAPSRLWTSLVLGRAALSAVLFGGAASAMIFLLPLALAEIDGWGPLEIGASLAALPLAMALSSTPSRTLPARRSMPLGAISVAAGLLALALAPGAAAFPVVPLGLAIVGAGLGLVAAPLWSATRPAACPVVAAAALGGSVLGIGAAAAVASGALATPEGEAGLRIALAVAAAASLGGLLLGRRAIRVSPEARPPA